MPNIGVVLKAEISRLCRREIRREMAATKRASTAHRSDIAALKRKVAELERSAALLNRRVATQARSVSTTPPARPVRFVAKGLRSLRARLGLSAPQLAKLIGVSEQSIYNWETKKATPRKEQLGRLIALRSVGKREVQRRLAEMTPPKKARRRRSRA